MWLRSDNFDDGSRIPDDNAFGNPAEEGHIRLGANKNPHLEWGDVPVGVRSFALLCIDSDVPSSGDDVNQEGKVVPSDLPRTDFVHWVLIDLSPDVSEIPESEYSNGVTAHGKPRRTNSPLEGINDYTGWFADDPDMSGTYHGYDGPCPPWNDSILHHYEFRLFALNTDSLALDGEFTADDVNTAAAGHILGSALLTGTYSLNPDVS